jgi:hypothetical protein
MALQQLAVGEFGAGIPRRTRRRVLLLLPQEAATRVSLPHAKGDGAQRHGTDIED